MKKKDPTFNRRVVIALVFLFVLFLFSSCSAVLLQLGDVDVGTGNVAVIPLSGVIVTSGNSFGSQVASADEIVVLLEKAKEDDFVDAVILEINSPGGSPVASDEIGRAVQELRDANKTVVAWIRETGASGAYWVASNADYIVANRMSITGSIGVVGSYFGFEEFIDEHNISYRAFTSGDKKDLGSPFRAMTEEEQAFFQKKIDDIHWFFVEEVSKNRNMTREDVEALATGEFYLGFEAEQNGLVDALGGKQEAIEYLEQQGVSVDEFPLETQRSFWEQLTSVEVNMNLPTNRMGITT